MDKTISLKTSQFPEEIIEQASRAIDNYATVLFYEDNVIGSGTFVQCDSIFGILTAHHVIREGIGLDSFKNGFNMVIEKVFNQDLAYIFGVIVGGVGVVVAGFVIFIICAGLIIGVFSD